MFAHLEGQIRHLRKGSTVSHGPVWSTETSGHVL